MHCFFLLFFFSRKKVKSFALSKKGLPRIDIGWIKVKSIHIQVVVIMEYHTQRWNSRVNKLVILRLPLRSFIFFSMFINYAKLTWKLEIHVDSGKSIAPYNFNWSKLWQQNTDHKLYVTSLISIGCRSSCSYRLRIFDCCNVLSNICTIGSCPRRYFLLKEEGTIILKLWLVIACVADVIQPRWVTSAKQCRDPCSGHPTDSANYRKWVSNFLQILISNFLANRQWHFK